MQPEPVIIVAVKSLLVYQRRALLLHRANGLINSPGIWEFPGGKLEFGESLHQAVQREILEETGIQADVQRLLYAADLKTHPHRQIIILNYLCQARGSAVVLSREHQNYLWATKKEMLELLDTAILKNLSENHIFDSVDLQAEP